MHMKEGELLLLKFDMGDNNTAVFDFILGLSSNVP
jgi:hypothetical protein